MAVRADRTGHFTT